MDTDKLEGMVRDWYVLHAEASVTDHALDWEAVDRAAEEIMDSIWSNECQKAREKHEPRPKGRAMNIRDVTTAVWNNDGGDHLMSRDMIRDDNGAFNLAKITTTTGHILIAGIEEDEDGTYVTYSIYAPGDEDMTEGPITTDGFEATSEEQAAAHLADVLTNY